MYDRHELVIAKFSMNNNDSEKKKWRRLDGEEEKITFLKTSDAAELKVLC